MANEPLVLARPLQTSAPGADDYEAFSEVLAASARGRAFLAEHARRSRTADTELLLAALARIEALVRANAAAPADPARAELRTLLAAIRSARPEIEASRLPARAAKLAVLLDLLEGRIAALAGPTPMPPALDATAEAARARLAVVPPPEEPELPIPSPAASQPPPIVLAQAAATPQPKAGTSIPEVNWLDGAPAAGVEDVAAAEPESAVALAIADMMDARASEPKAKPPEPAAPPDEARLWALSDAKLAPPPSDPLAAIMLLSEEERIALFT
jgi:hypothetical protein